MDALIQAIEALEVAVDDYAADQSRQSRMVPGSRPSAWAPTITRQHADEIEKAAVEVALAMVDADVQGCQSAEQIPSELRESIADAEIRALHGDQVLVKRAKCRRCAGTGQFITRVENGVPTGPGGECFRCGGKGYQTVADRRRNYGHDNFAPIAI